jgi:L-alanine-DL-glutamate epimerase-like enolase superfamily enzyme
MTPATSNAAITRIDSAAYRIPTETPESDGTLEWDSTTLVTVHLEAGGQRGFGYTYADAACVALIADKLAPLLLRRDAMAVTQRWQEMAVAVRNLGRAGIAAAAISAVDAALWDVKAKILGVPLVTLLGRARPAIALYGSGGFTSYDDQHLRGQLEQWVQSGMQRVKMKVGHDPDRDVERVRSARAAIGDAPELFVDANGAYQRKQALEFARRFRDSGVTWFEEPVSSDDLEGLRLLRDQGPPGMAITAGEYGYDLPYFRRMLEAQAVDILQADASRCGGVTGFLGAAALCQAFGIPLSSHCVPTLHLPLCCAAQQAVHLEWFHDHARIEHMLFDGAASPDNGRLAPDSGRPGLGVEFKEKDAQCYRI